MSKTMLSFIMFLILYPHQSLCVANLKYFETLSHVGVTSIAKRSRDGTENLMKYVRFRAFDRNFGLTLKSDTHLMAEGFTACLVDEHGNSTYFNIDQSTIFSGHLKDKPNVRVHAHIEDTLWTIQIYDEDDIYAIEPAWRLLNQTENPKNDTMIAYRASDLSSDSFNSSSFCGIKDHVKRVTPYQRFATKTARPRVRKVPDEFSYFIANGGRSKNFDLHSACLLFLAGDYTFFKGHCNGNKAVCAALMFSYTKMADEVYKRSVFKDTNRNTFTGIGLVVGEIVLFSTYTLHSPDYRFIHFNENKEWKVNAKLDTFARYASYIGLQKQYCAYHLFTDYPFNGRVLGFAWPSTLCQSKYQPGRRSKNSGLTSGSDIAKGHISTLQMNLIYIHGHNFGSNHDEETAQCSKPQTHGGNYIMSSRSVNGKFDNNYKFSPCSLREIGALVKTFTCLISRELITSYCGNGVIDNNEECDAGALGVIDTDPCCTNKCKLRNYSNCSDLNFGCCHNCSLSPAQMLCRGAERQECREPSYCTGNNQTCPESPFSMDLTPCIDHGFCYSGICKDFCEVKSIKEGNNLKRCLCRSNDNGEACKWCCFDDSKPGLPGPCEMHSNETLMDGSHCYKGYCKAGVCEDYPVVSTYQRIYVYLPSINISKLGQFIKSNIVLVVILLVLFCWLPPVYLINQADKREKEIIIQEKEILTDLEKGFKKKNIGKKQRTDQLMNSQKELKLYYDVQSILESHDMREMQESEKWLDHEKRRSIFSIEIVPSFIIQELREKQEIDQLMKEPKLYYDVRSSHESDNNREKQEIDALLEAQRRSKRHYSLRGSLDSHELREKQEIDQLMKEPKLYYDVRSSHESDNNREKQEIDALLEAQRRSKRHYSLRGSLDSHANTSTVVSQGTYSGISSKHGNLLEQKISRDMLLDYQDYNEKLSDVNYGKKD